MTIAVREGWRCPGCGACFAPSVERCPDCPGPAAANAWPRCTCPSESTGGCPVHPPGRPRHLADTLPALKTNFYCEELMRRWDRAEFPEGWNP